MPQPKDKAFKDLQDKWYKKLKKEGFEDIEQNETSLKVWHSTEFAIRESAVTREAKEEYCRLAGQFYFEHPFQTPVQKAIWGMHADGISILDIVARLKAKRFKVYKRSVHEIIQNLRKIMVQRARQR